MVASTRHTGGLDQHIAQLREEERTYTRLVAEACAAALAAPTSVGYERESRRANALEAVAAQQRRLVQLLATALERAATGDQNGAESAPPTVDFGPEVRGSTDDQPHTGQEDAPWSPPPQA